MSNFYVIIQTGYEGIEELCYLTDNPVDAIEKLKRFQDREIKERKELNRRMNEQWIKEGMPELVEETKFAKEEIQNIKDFFCIQKWDGKEFKCCCSELKVSPSKLMLR